MATVLFNLKKVILAVSYPNMPSTNNLKRRRCLVFGVTLLTHLLIRGGQSATKKIVRIMPISVKEPRNPNSGEFQFAGFDIDEDGQSKAAVCSDKSCFVYDQFQIANGICDLSNNTDCCFDGGDCCDLSDSVKVSDSPTKEKSPFTDLSYIFNQICPDCDRIRVEEIGNRVCDYRTALDVDCCFDGGDCLIVEQSANDCLQCIIPHSQSQFFPACPDAKISSNVTCTNNANDDPTFCFGAIDCHDCLTCFRPDFVSDNYCDIELLINACCLDGGDCDSTKHSVDLCPSCHFKKYMQQIGDGTCHYELTDHDCCFDGGDCSRPAENSAAWCSSCSSNKQGLYYDLYLSNGICETQYNRSECCFDGSDCIINKQEESCPSCSLDYYQAYVSNRRCDRYVKMQRIPHMP